MNKISAVLLEQIPAKILFFLSFIILQCSLSFAQNDNISVKIIETDPLPGKILHKNESLYLHISYESNIPLRFQAKAFYHGKSQGAAMNPAPQYASGKGEALAWVFFYKHAQIDEIRLDVYNDKWQKIKTIPFKINMNWIDSYSNNDRVVPEWVQNLKTEQQNMVDQNVQSDGGFWTDLVFMFIGLIVPGYFVLQIYMGVAYKQGWRKAALFPLIIMVPILIYSLFALLQGANLWPIFLIFASPFGFLYLSGLGIFKFIKERA